MDFASVVNKNEPHQRTIIHLDMDYYYAQVEEIRDPTLKTLPLGVQQKDFVVTANYIARAKGVKKLMTLTEAKRLCPDLVLVNGEDLTPYRKMSQQIFEVLLNYTPMVEKLGFDENYMDVTTLVSTREQQQSTACVTVNDYNMEMPQVVGHIYPDDGTMLTACDCGCAPRLALGTQIAKEIRDELKTRLDITCCAGVSYNKLLAKLIGSRHKPNQQTTLVSTYAEQFMRELKDLHLVTGIGQKTETLLMENGITNVEQLQQYDMDLLRKKLGFETAKKLKDLSYGRDPSDVRPSGKPKSIGLEDSCRPISVRTEVEERFRLLLMRLIEQVAEDGRIPIAVKVILRKYNSDNKTSHRESKQANILPSLFKTVSSTEKGSAKVILADGAQEKLLKIIMRLFERVVDLNKPFNITLIGLAFSKFQQRKAGSASIANFLIKKTDLEVQSITSLTNSTNASAQSESPTPSVSSSHSDEVFNGSSPTTFQPSDQFYRRRTTAVSPIPMLMDNGSESGATNSDFSDFSETEVEPSPKKCRIGRVHLPKRRCFHASSAVYSSDIASDVASPSKLRVSDLHLSSEKDSSLPSSSSKLNSHETNVNPIAPTTTLSNLSLSTTTLTNPTVQRIQSVQRPTTIFTRNEGFRSTVQITIPESPISSTLSETSASPSPMDEGSSGRTTPSISFQQEAAMPTTTPVNQSTNFPIPAEVNQEVFNELPQEVKNELINSWRNSIVSAATVVTNGNVSPLVGRTTSFIPHSMASRNLSNNSNSNRTTGSNSNSQSASSAAATGGGAQKNTLYRYFLRNK